MIDLVDRAGVAGFGVDPLGEGFGFVEGEDGAAAGVGFEEVGEAGFDAGGFVAEGEGSAWGGKVVGQADAVSGGLGFDADEGGAGAFGFDDADGGTIDVEEVVGETVTLFEGEFADGDALGGGEIDLVAGLEGPVSGGEEAVDFYAGLLLRGHWLARANFNDNGFAGVGLLGGMVWWLPRG